MKISFPTLHVLAVKCQQFEQTAMLHSAEEELKNTTSKPKECETRGSRRDLICYILIYRDKYNKFDHYVVTRSYSKDHMDQ